jgi:hypothetical protein
MGGKLLHHLAAAQTQQHYTMSPAHQNNKITCWCKTTYNWQNLQQHWLSFCNL